MPLTEVLAGDTPGEFDRYGIRVPMALVWLWVLNPDYGILNRMLNLVGIVGPNWLGNPQFALLAVVLLSAWNFGLPMVVLIAGLQNIQ